MVPPKLVKRIQKAEYVDMAELLKDNMEAERRRMLSDSAFLRPTSLIGQLGEKSQTC